jgi:hypothetical protein
MQLLLTLSSAASGYDGTGWALVSLLLGLFMVGLWFWAVLVALYLTIPLGAIGLLLGIIGLRRARRWHNNRRARTLAILGIVLNSVLLGGFILLLVLVFVELGQH